MSQESMIMRRVRKQVLYVCLSIGAIIYIYPLFWLIINSLKNTTAIFEKPWGLPVEWIWYNYVTAWGDGKTGTGLYFLNSVLVTVVTLVLVMLISSMAAFALVKLKWRASNATFIYFIIGLMVPLQATLIPLFVLFSKLGLLNSHLGLILIYTAFGLSTPILILYGFMMGMPREMMEAAVMDGCSIHGVFWRMMIPVMQPALMTVAILSFVSIWNELLVALIFLSDLKKMTLPVGLLTFQGEYSTNFAPLFAAVVMATVPTLIVCYIFSKRIIAGLTAGAIKG
jgi:raffinose/stachyose/melibiose transport system permease protein